MKRQLWYLIVGMILLGPAGPRMGGQTASAPLQPSDIDPVVHALCGKRVALLGESPIHGFGRTLEFKTALVRRLVDECHYNALFFESGTYDFINIRRRLRANEDVSEDTIFSAVGGLWANKEVQSLVPFLREKAKAGTLALGGLDDQINRKTWAQQQMSSELVQVLQGDSRSRCLAVLQKHMLWQYTDEAPYSPADKEKILGCLNEVEGALPQSGIKLSLSTEEIHFMSESLKRNYGRNFVEDDFKKHDQAVKWFNDRDRSMYLNFQWLQSRLPRHSKVIVWAATVHVAKGFDGLAAFEGRKPVGLYVEQEYKHRAFALGFSAYSGSYYMVRPPIQQLPIAPITSLEARVLEGQDASTVYLPAKQLHQYGQIEARPLDIKFTTAHWDHVLDGLIIFREERAPEALPF